MKSLNELIWKDETLDYSTTGASSSNQANPVFCFTPPPPTPPPSFLCDLPSLPQTICTGFKPPMISACIEPMGVSCTGNSGGIGPPNELTVGTCM